MELTGNGENDLVRSRVTDTLGSWIIRIVGRTARKRVEIHADAKKLLDAGAPLIFSLFHSQIIFPIWYHRFSNTDILVSSSADGEIIAGIVNRLGYGKCVGSAREGGVTAAKEMVRSLRNGRRIGFTVDGPLGPALTVKPGIIWLASYTGNPILPLACHSVPCKRFASWDRFMLPLPFSKVYYLVGKPFMVPRIHREPKQVEIYREELENRMIDLSRQVGALS